jgi:Flp pilus assembly protein CpaB
LRGRWLFVLGLFLAVVAAVSTYGFLEGLDQRVPVVVAARDLTRWERIEAGDLELRYLHPEAVLSDAIRLPGQIIGRQVTQPILCGEQISPGRTDLEPSGWMAYGLGPGTRAMFIPAAFQRAAGGALTTGDRVDLVAVISNREEPVAYRLARSLEVLEIRDDRGRPWSERDDRQVIGGALLAVSDHEAEAIALAISCGQVYLLLTPEEPVQPLHSDGGTAK